MVTPAKKVSVQRERLLRAQASRAELKLAEERREVIPIPTAEAEWGRLVVNFRQRMLALPSKVSFQIIGCNSQGEVNAILEKEIHAALRELAEGKWLPEPPEVEKPKRRKPARRAKR